MEVERRSKKKPRRRWSIDESTLILNFIKGMDPHVTADNLLLCLDDICETVMNDVPIGTCTKDQLKNKIRNMKSQYVVACEWINRIGLRILEEKGYDFFRNKILRQCPLFDDLDEIYGSLGLVRFCFRNLRDGVVVDRNTVTQGISDSVEGENNQAESSPENLNAETAANVEDLDQRETVTSQENEASLVESVEEVPSIPEPSDSANDPLQQNSIHDVESNTESSNQSETIAQQENECEIDETNTKKVDFEFKKLEFDNKKLEFEKEKWHDEKILRKMELEIQKTKLEEDARTARYEMQMKMLIDICQKY